MTLRRCLALLLLAAAAVPGGGAAADVRLVEREEPLSLVRAVAARPAPLGFNMVGLHWRGSGEVWFRTAVEPGRWSAWQPARPEADDLPDAGSSEAVATAGWNVGNPYWTGDARWIQYRVSGSVSRLRAFFVSSPVQGSAPSAPAAAATAARATQPSIVRRAGWRADESIVRDAPSYAEQVRLAVVHHTAGTNSYSASQSAAIVRGIQRYHVVSNGWDDIGYNFLVDKYGRIFEGRGGGIAQNVIGAHAQGFNTGSVGVALLGTYEGGKISSAARAALQRLLAWRLDVAHVDPLSLLTFASYGNPRFAPGTRVRLRAISGHRDTGYTSCPGTALYGQLGTVARAVSTIGLPKLYEPRVAGGLGGAVRFTARLSSARAWTVRIRDGQGAVVAQGSGSGTHVDWTWDSSSAPPDVYGYAIEAGTAVLAASGRVPGPPPLAVRGLRASGIVLTPNGDGSGERARFSFTLSRNATVGVHVLSGSTVVRTLLSTRGLGGGLVKLAWNGLRDDGSAAADGRYRVRVEATVGAEHVVAYSDVVVDRTLGFVSAAPVRFSPNRDRRLETTEARFTLTRSASVRVRVVRAGRTVATLVSGTLPAGTHVVPWNGRAGARRAADGAYEIVVQATTTLGTRTLRGSVVLDATRPVVRVVSLRRVPGGTVLRFRLSESAVVRAWFGRRRWSDGRDLVFRRAAGNRSVLYPRGASVVRVVATDLTRIPSVPVVFRAG